MPVLCVLGLHRPHIDIYTEHDGPDDVLVERVSCARCTQLIAKAELRRMPRPPVCG